MKAYEFETLGIEIPPNRERMTNKEFKKWEEHAYHMLYIRKWSFMPGDSRLKSMDPDGNVKVGVLEEKEGEEK